MNRSSAEYLINRLNLTKHPEGGYYKEVYRSNELINKNALPDRFKGDRSFSTSIYFLLTKEEYSSLHRIQSDEIWHYYEGGAAEVFVIHRSGKLETIKLGSRPDEGEVYQAVVPAGTWFGTKVFRGDYILTGCTVAPGFDFEDFELADTEILLKLYPAHEKIIKMLAPRQNVQRS